MRVRFDDSAMRPGSSSGTSDGLCARALASAHGARARARDTHHQNTAGAHGLDVRRVQQVMLAARMRQETNHTEKAHASADGALHAEELAVDARVQHAAHLVRRVAAVFVLDAHAPRLALRHVLARLVAAGAPVRVCMRVRVCAVVVGVGVSVGVSVAAAVAARVPGGERTERAVVQRHCRIIIVAGGRQPAPLLELLHEEPRRLQARRQLVEQVHAHAQLALHMLLHRAPTEHRWRPVAHAPHSRGPPVACARARALACGWCVQVAAVVAMAFRTRMSFSFRRCCLLCHRCWVHRRT